MLFFVSRSTRHRAHDAANGRRLFADDAADGRAGGPNVPPSRVRAWTHGFLYEPAATATAHEDGRANPHVQHFADDLFQGTAVVLNICILL